MEVILVMDIGVRDLSMMRGFFFLGGRVSFSSIAAQRSGGLEPVRSSGKPPNSSCMALV